MATPDGPPPGKDAPKGAVPPVPVKKAKPGVDDEADEKKSGGGSETSAKFLPTGLSRAIVVAAVIASIALMAGNLLASRYDLVPAPNSANGFMYRIDRLTGDVQFCGPQGCSDVPNRSSAEK